MADDAPEEELRALNRNDNTDIEQQSLIPEESPLPYDDQDIDIQRWTQQLQDLKDFMAQTKTKWVFIYSVINFAINMAGLGGGWFAGIIPWYYTIKFPIMIYIRFTYYSTKSWQWFLLDFCYFANVALLIYLWIYPSPQFFCFIFSVANGTLLWAILIFGNGLVFHSLDKTTSLLIHITPSLITYIIRWTDTSFWDIGGRWKSGICITDRFEDGYNDIHNGCANWWNMVLYPFIFTICQQMVYYLLVQVVFYERIKNDKNSLTSYTYLFRKGQRNGPVWDFINIAGKRGRIYVFGGFFVMYSTVSYLPTLLFYRYQWMQFVFMVICMTWAVKNGAEFYATVYVKKGSLYAETENDDEEENEENEDKGQ